MPPGDARTAHAPAVVAYTLVALIAASLAYDVYRIPIQVSDSLDVIVRGVEAPSTRVLFADAIHDSPTTLRPMRYVLARWLAEGAEAAGVSYRAAFRGTHAAMIVAALLLFVAALRITTWNELAAMSGAAAVLLGHHTFSRLWREAYPVNHYAFVVVCCIGILALARRKPLPGAPLLLGAVLAFGLLLIESAVLIWGVTVACWAVRLPGIRKAAAVATTVVLVVMAIARVALGITVPGIGGQGSGYLDQFYSGAELRARFGESNAGFVAYNVIGGAGSVLFSEPRLGVYRSMLAARQGHFPPVLLINVVSSLLATALIGWFVVFRLGRRWRDWTDTDRITIVAIAAIVMNACLVPTYIKDEILGVAGVFYAVAVFCALRSLIDGAHRRTGFAVAVLAVTLTVGGALWTIRAAGIPYDLQRATFYARTEWVLQVARPHVSKWSQTPRGVRVVERLRQEAIDDRRPGWTLLPRWGEPLWLVE